MTHIVRLLHLSDLRAQPGSDEPWHQRDPALGSAWKRNLSTLLAEEGPIDLICLTGDVAAARGTPVRSAGRRHKRASSSSPSAAVKDASTGATKGEDATRAKYRAAGEFLQRLSTLSKVDPSRIFIVPGNHDMAQRLPAGNWGQMQERVLAGDRERLSRWLAGGRQPPEGLSTADRNLWFNRRRPYQDWIRHDLKRPELLPGQPGLHPSLGYRCLLRPSETIPFGIHIIGLETAWLAGAKDDRGRLLLTEDQILRLAAAVDGGPLPGFRLALMHHPLGWLADGVEAGRLLATHTDLLLHGHMRPSERNLWVDPDQTLLQAGAGRLSAPPRPGSKSVQNRVAGPRSGMTLITLTLTHDGRPVSYDFRFRAWSEAEGAWHDDPEMAPPDDRHRSHWTFRFRPEPLTPPPTWAGSLFVDRDEALGHLVRTLLLLTGPASESHTDDRSGAEKRTPRFFTPLFPAGLSAPIAEEPKPGSGSGSASESESEQGPQVTAVVGEAGVGKAFLVDRFHRMNHRAFPGGFGRVFVDATGRVDRGGVLRAIADLIGESRAEPLVLAERLGRFPTLIHIAGVDSDGAARAVANAIRSLHGVPVVVSGRWHGLGAVLRCPMQVLPPLERGASLELMARWLDVSESALETPEHRALIHALGGVPVALLWAAEQMRAGVSADRLYRIWTAGEPDLDRPHPSDGPVPAHPSPAERLHPSLILLRRQAGIRGIEALATLAHAPAEGMGDALGAVFTGLDPEAFLTLCQKARNLSLLGEISVEGALGAVRRWRVPPLPAALLRNQVDPAPAVDRLTRWFFQHLPESSPAGPGAWTRITAEWPTLVHWLERVPTTDIPAVAEAGATFAMINGPFAAWADLSARGLQAAPNLDSRAAVLWLQALMQERLGDLDGTVEAACALAEVERARKDDRGLALAAGLIADVLTARGKREQALQVRREVELPIYEAEDDRHAVAVTKNQIADIEEARGNLDEAVRLRRREVLPLLHLLGDVRGQAAALSRIADALDLRGQSAVALRLRRLKVLPTLERLGQIRSVAALWCRIADGLAALGRGWEAVAVLEQKAGPVFERLGDANGEARTRARLVALRRELQVVEAKTEALKAGAVKVGPVQAEETGEPQRRVEYEQDAPDEENGEHREYGEDGEA